MLLWLDFTILIVSLVWVLTIYWPYLGREREGQLVVQLWRILEEKFSLEKSGWVYWSWWLNKWNIIKLFLYFWKKVYSQQNINLHSLINICSLWDRHSPCKSYTDSFDISYSLKHQDNIYLHLNESHRHILNINFMVNNKYNSVWYWLILWFVWR